MAGKLAPVPCPKCGGPCWDNVATKRNPKAPDYACKDKEGCGAGVWLKDSEKNALQAAKPGSPQAKRPIVIDSLMEQRVIAAKELLGKNVPPGPPVSVE